MINDKDITFFNKFLFVTYLQNISTSNSLLLGKQLLIQITLKKKLYTYSNGQKSQNIFYLFKLYLFDNKKKLSILTKDLFYN